MSQALVVAVPWSLSHYIPLNGFHPIYRALFDWKPDWVEFSAWDNIELSQRLRGDVSFRSTIQQEVDRDAKALNLRTGSSIDKDYFAHFWAPNLALTRLLPGDIEFHHTAPFPSLERPFVFHCESFAPVFFPFAHQGTGNFESKEQLRAHYRGLFENPLCLGIYSHLPQTLEDLSRFFGSSFVDAKLLSSRIGIYDGNSGRDFPQKGPLSAPLFLFINSANQNRGNFFLRGGHLVLRFWQLAYPEPGAGRLIMRCARPTDAMLREHGVDLNWLSRHERRSVIWIEDFLSLADLDTLMLAAHFFLLPSASLHSVSIMQAMAAGAVPVVSDTIGTDRYIEDGVDGIRLCGVLANNWHRDRDTGVMIDRYARNPELEDALVRQLLARISDLLATPPGYREMQTRTLRKAREEFSGQSFSEDFWCHVRQRYLEWSDRAGQSVPRSRNRPEIANCLVEHAEWSRIFSSAPQPVLRLHTGQGQVTELGGCFIAVPGNRSIALHDWSPIAEHVDVSAPSLTFAKDIKGLGGSYLVCSVGSPVGATRRRLIAFVAERLMPYPRLYLAASGLLRLLRRGFRAVSRRFQGRSAATKTRATATASDIELVQSVKGLNVIRSGHLYYAIPPEASEFCEARAKAGKYAICVRGSSLKDVLHQLESMPEPPPAPDIELIEEGVHGFNLIRCEGLYYALPQSEGPFDLGRIHANAYRRLHIGDSVEEVRAAVFRTAS